MLVYATIASTQLRQIHHRISVQAAPMNAMRSILLSGAIHVRVTNLNVMERVPARAVSNSGSNASEQLAFAADQSRDLQENVTAMISAVIALRNTIYVSERSILIDSNPDVTIATALTDSAAVVLHASDAIIWVLSACIRNIREPR